MAGWVNFGAAISLRIGFLLLLGVALFVLLGGWVVQKAYLWSRRAAASEAKRRRRLGPAIGRGVCTACLRASDEVYHVAPGVRLCPPCYQRQQHAASAGA